MKLKLGQHLFTKDGRIVGNAIVTEINKGVKGVAIPLYRIETDFGNGGSLHTISEITNWWHVVGADGLPVISEVERWRLDRQLRIGDQIPTLAERCMELIDELRNPEGAAVTIQCPNHDFNGLPNESIIVNSDWTSFEDRRFEGDTVLACLTAARDARGPVMPPLKLES